MGEVRSRRASLGGGDGGDGGGLLGEWGGFLFSFLEFCFLFFLAYLISRSLDRQYG